MQQRILLFELNEVPSRILEHYCRLHPRSGLATLLPACQQYETYTEDIGSLSPWRTWPSLHRGVSNAQHRISDFGEDLTQPDAEFPPIWKLLTQHGASVGLCGTLHSYPMPSDLERYRFYLPDAFAAGSECFPESLQPFQDLNLRLSRASARNVPRNVPWAAALRTLRKLPALGLRATTYKDVAAQLVSERLAPWKVNRRRTTQSVLAFDLFMHQLARTRPDFASFFTNHVASAMHRYWAAAFPADYDDFQFEADWVDTYRGEIDFAMQKADQMFTRLVDFARRHGYSVWLTTSMGQQATIALPLETQLYVTDLGRFMSALGMQPADWSERPAMAPQVNVAVAAERGEEFARKLAGIAIGGAPLEFRQRESTFFSLDFGHMNLHREPPFAVRDGQAVAFAALGLETVEIQDKSNTTAYHIPQGCLLIHDPTASRRVATSRSQVSTLDLAPAILRNYGVRIPAYMRAAPAL